jgi:2-methylisocitrate lyase-like PEP mutase family enzyme
MGANTPEELRYVAGVVRAPLVTVIQESAPTNQLTDAVLQEVGCVLALHAGTTRYAAVQAIHEVLSTLHRDQHTHAVNHRMASFEQYNQALGLPAWLALEAELLKPMDSNN